MARMNLKISKNEAKFKGDPGKPMLLMIESYQGMNKKQMLNYIYGLAEKHSQSLRGCYYQIVKFGDGYIAELHDGGNGFGILQSMLQYLEDHEEAIVETAERNVRIVKRKTSKGVSFKAYTLNEDDKSPPTDSIAYVDKLEPVITPGYGLWRFSVWFAAMGIVTMLSGAVFKYVVYDNSYQTNFSTSGKDVPLKQLNELIIAKPKDGNYISALKYANKSWSREEKQIPLPKPISDLPELKKPQAQNSADLDQQLKDLEGSSKLVQPATTQPPAVEKP
ncbi:hypothetical protein RYA05_05375 [Pseudomonas syringae pv. actinidiae]|nr:hypothetical protein [Pseudomonas syringae pv. actinidiae]